MALASGCGGGSETAASNGSFEPQASLEAVGGTARTEKPQFVLRVVTRRGDANIRSVAVNLPPVVLGDPTAIGDVCPRRDLESDRCAGHPRLGFARVVSPAYKGPLSGPVYPVSGSGGLPRLVYVLRGPAEIQLEGRVVSKGGRIQAGVEDIPDTPLREFEFRIDGGKRGYLVLSRDICAAEAVADATFTSQDGQDYQQKVPLKADCPG